MATKPLDATEDRRIRVALIDDQSLVRQAVAALLRVQPDLDIVGEFSTATEALAALAVLDPDVILLDLDLGAESGVSFPAPARAAGYRGKILVVTGVDDQQQIARALRAGANAVYTKARSATDLPDVIRRVSRGETYVDPEFLEYVIEFAATGAVEPAPASALSSREHAVLDAVAAGLSNKEIATRFGVSEPAIKAALQRLFAKYGVRTRTQLAAAILQERASH